MSIPLQGGCGQWVWWQRMRWPSDCWSTDGAGTSNPCGTAWWTPNPSWARVAIWQQGAAMIPELGQLGPGPDRFRMLMDRTVFNPGVSPDLYHPHNVLLESLLRWGVPGLLPTLFLLLLLWTSLRARRRDTRDWICAGLPPRWRPAWPTPWWTRFGCCRTWQPRIWPWRPALDANDKCPNGCGSSGRTALPYLIFDPGRLLRTAGNKVQANGHHAPPEAKYRRP